MAWNDVDKTCPNCGQVTQRVRGITKQNLMRLIKPQFNINEVIITIMLLMFILVAFVYKYETAQCRDWINPMFEDNGAHCLSTCSQRCELVKGKVEEGLTWKPPVLNVTGINLTGNG